MVVSPARKDNIPIFQANHGGVPADFLVAGNSDGDYGYYRQPNGFITVSEIGKGNHRLHAYQDEGWVPLVREYGAFDFPKEYYVNHPFEVLFLRGGAHEMPVAQIKALGFDRHPPLLPRCNLALGNEHMGPTKRPLHYDRCWLNAQPVAFPQLGGAYVPDIVQECEFCDRADFTSKKGREQHMRVLHVEELREISTAREMAKGMRDAVGAAVQGIAGGNASLGGVGLPIAGMAARPFACGLCGESFPKMRGPEGLEPHVKLHADVSDGENTEDA